jgi:hypothetical protein
VKAALGRLAFLKPRWSARSGFASACQHFSPAAAPPCQPGLPQAEAEMLTSLRSRRADMLICRSALTFWWVVGMWMPDGPLSGLCYLSLDGRILVSVL